MLSTSGFSSKLPSLAFFVVLHYNIVIIDKTKNEVKILDITIPADAWVKERETEKTEIYKILKDKIFFLSGFSFT